MQTAPSRLRCPTELRFGTLHSLPALCGLRTLSSVSISVSHHSRPLSSNPSSGPGRLGFVPELPGAVLGRPGRGLSPPSCSKGAGLSLVPRPVLPRFRRLLAPWWPFLSVFDSSGTREGVLSAPCGGFHAGRQSQPSLVRSAVPAAQAVEILELRPTTRN